MTVQSLVARVSSAAIAISLFAGAPALAATRPAQAAANGWGTPLTDVKPDASIRYGKLPNGMKYAIMRNATPKGAASVRLRFEFGSIAEKENQRGLAHFIEHMAFNGSTHVPEGDMIKILERQGLAFGPDTNAVTGFDSTTYMLDLPKADAEHMDTAMFLLREVASEVKFDPAAVDRERGVILGEKRARDSFQLRQLIDVRGFQLPQTPYPRRLPIGVDEVLKNASAETIRNLYRSYYRPENATLVFVGDADPAVVEAKIQKSFADWKNAAPAGAALPRGRVDVSRPAAFDTFVHPAVATTIDYSVLRPFGGDPDTLADRREKMVRQIATDMFNRRLGKVVNGADSPLLGGAMFTQEQKDAAEETSLKLAAKDGAWKEAVNTAEQEVRRALQYGFTAGELKTQLADTGAKLRTAAEQAGTRTNQNLVQSILGSIDADKFVTTPAYQYELFQSIAKSITPADIDRAFKAVWTGSAPLVHLSAKQDVPLAQLGSAFTASTSVAVAAPKAVETQAFAYDSFGAPTKVVSDTRVGDLGVRTVRFANNVRLNIKKTDFETGKVRFLVRFGDGVLDLPRDKPGLASMLSFISAPSAVAKHSLEELKEITAGRVVALGAGVSDDAFVAAGATTPQDLALQMKISAAFLTDPGFRPEAASKWQNIVPVIEKQLDAGPQTVAQVRLPIVLADNDARFGVPATAILAQRNFDEARAALKPVIAGAPIEITIVGDVNEDSTIGAVASSFGALPKRQEHGNVDPTARQASFRTERTPILMMHDGPADQVLVQASWPTDDDHDFRKVVSVDMLKNVLDLMLTDSVREKLGDSYGVAIQSVMSSTFKGFGYLSASAIVAPDRADEVEKAYAEAAAELRYKPISADLLARARNPELERIDRSMRENGYWLGAIAKAQSEPERLQRIRERRAIVQSITPPDLQELARKYLQPGSLQLVRIVSSRTAGAKVGTTAAP